MKYIILIIFLLLFHTNLNSNSISSYNELYKELTLDENYNTIYIYNAKDCDCHDESYRRYILKLLKDKNNYLLYISDSRNAQVNLGKLPNNKYKIFKTSKIKDRTLFKYEFAKITKIKGVLNLFEVKITD